MKKLTFALIVLALTLALVGQAPARAQTLTLTYLASQGWIKDGELALAKQFETATGIHIDYQIIPADQYFNVLQTKLNTGEGPDIFGGQSGVSDLKVVYNVEKNAVDLSNESWVKTEDPLSLAQNTLNGKIYGLTIWDTRGGVFAVVYSKPIFEKLGLKVPTDYASFKAACQKILESGVTPVYEPIADGWHHVLWFPELGARYEEVTPGLVESLNANKAKFAGNATMTTALTQLQEMYKLGFFGKNAMTDTYDKANEKLANGSYAMVVSPLTTPANIEKGFKVAADKFGFFVMPLADNQSMNLDPAGPTKFIYSGSKHIKEAKQYFDFLTKPESLQYLVENEPTFSSVNFSGIKDKFTADQKKFFETYTKRGPGLQISVNYVNPQWMDIGKDMSAMFLGSLKPEDVLKNVDQRRADAAKAAKDPAWAQ